jgi:hypothetical protein
MRVTSWVVLCAVVLATAAAARADGSGGGSGSGSGKGDSSASTGIAMRACEVPIQPVDWCTESQIGLYRGSSYLVCIDAETGCIVGGTDRPDHLDRESDPHTILPANRPIWVLVSSKSQTIDVSLDGEIGTSLAKIEDAPVHGETVARIRGDEGTQVLLATEPSLYLARFAPRKPGKASITLTVTPTKLGDEAVKVAIEAVNAAVVELHNVAGKLIQDAIANPLVPENIARHIQEAVKAASDAAAAALNLTKATSPHAAPAPPVLPACTHGCAYNNVSSAAAAAAKDDTTKDATKLVYRFEFYVPQAYSGALRLGVSAIHVAGLAHNYGLRQAAGASFSEIVDNGADPYAYELVVGYSVFLLNLPCGGRVYHVDDPWWGRFALYGGIGALSSSPSSKLEWLRSLYLGPEYEISPSSSIALTGVVRRVDELANGLSPGMTVSTGTSLTRPTYELGIGFVVNFTPSFFQFASASLPKL